jgi:3-methyl-2-oxobutanoate hydroxymethyltransferase
LIDDARILEESGAALLLMELVPAALAKQITEVLHIPTIGIGAGGACSAQVLVLHDMLGLYQEKKLKFIKNFMENACSIQEAVRNYVEAVKNNQFPDREHEY